MGGSDEEGPLLARGGTNAEGLPVAVLGAPVAAGIPTNAVCTATSSKPSVLPTNGVPYITAQKAVEDRDKDALFK